MSRSVDFFGQLERQGLHRRSRPRTAINAIIIWFLGIFLLVGITSMGMLLYKRHTIGVQIGAIEGYLSDPVVVSEYESVSRKLTKTGLINEYAGKLERFYEAVETYPSLDAHVLQMIWASRDNDTEISAFSFEGDRFTLTCVSSTRAGPASFADRLSSSALFTGVEYTGFAKGEDGQYRFNLTGRVKGGENNAAD